MKSLAWKDVDEKWFNELINKKEENLLQNIYRSNSVSSNDQSPTELDDDEDENNLNDTIIFDATLHSYF